MVIRHFARKCQKGLHQRFIYQIGFTKHAGHAQPLGVFMRATQGLLQR